MTVADNIKQIRRLFEVTQKDLAEIAGVSENAVSKWENGYAEPRMGAVERIAACYGLSKYNIIENDGMKGVAVNPRTRQAVLPTRSEYLPVSLPITSSDAEAIPVKVIGTVHAGSPDEGFECQKTALLPKPIADRHKQAFALQARGWCMDNVFSDQSIVFVDPDMQPRDNSICVFLLDGTDTVVRRLRVGSAFDMLTPDSHDKTIEDIIVKKDGSRECVCQGVVFFYQAPREME